MAITVEDIKLMASQRLSDTEDGGGMMTGNEIVDGNVNNLFPDISRLDRVYGRVSLRKAFASVQTANSDAYSGAHIILSAPAVDPHVNVCLFSTDSPTDTRDKARDYIESYVVKGPRYSGWLWGPHPEGSRSLLIFAIKGTPLPDIGDILFLDDQDGGQYVRITEAKATTSNFSSSTDTGYYGAATTFSRDIFTLQISQPLRNNHNGVEISKNDNIATSVYSTTVHDAAKYYGVMLPTKAIAKNDISIDVNSIFTKIVPSAQRESPVVDLSIGKSGPVVGSGQLYTVAVPAQTWANGSQVYFCRGIKPGSLTITGGGRTFTDDSSGLLMEGATQRGSVDYSTGDIIFSNITSFSAAFTAQAIIGAQINRVPETSFIEIASANRGYNYTTLINPLPTPGTLVVDYMAQGKWYRLKDNGRGTLEPLVEGTGTGLINYTTGSVVITCAAIPDISTLIILTWGIPVESIDVSGTVSIDVARVSHTLSNLPVKPGSLIISWPSGSNTVTATDNGSGGITGSATGSINYLTGLLTFKPTQVPASGGQYTISHHKYNKLEGQMTGSGGHVFNGTIPGAPLRAGSVKLVLAVNIRGASRVLTFTDNGSGSLNAPSWKVDYPVSHPTWPGSSTFNAVTGTIDYITGAVQVNLAGLAGTETWREPIEVMYSGSGLTSYSWGW